MLEFNNMIEEYKFGSIVINGNSYDYDVEVRFDDKVFEWRRGESHLVHINDIKRALLAEPDLIIFGTGQTGGMEVSLEVREKIKNQGIALEIFKTAKAVKEFNKAVKNRKAIGLFHLTC